MTKLIGAIIVLVVYAVALMADEKRGQISGQVIDGATEQPLVGVNIIIVEKPAVGSITDERGNFVISNIEVGEFSLRATLLGYTPVVLTNVVVSTGRSAIVKIKLSEEAINLQGVEVKADYFSRAGSISPVSTIGLSGAEVLRSPGSDQDVQRIVQSMPGVANSTDQTNELIVRGGAPNENLTVMDYLEIPSTNHYPNQMNSGGPINMVNVDLVEEINFSSGGFPAQYGDKLSSVMDITLREGDRQRAFASNTGIHFAGFGTVMEGGMNNGRGSWIVSARRSFLETIDNLVGISALGLTAIPKYYDAQFKVVYDLSPSQKLLFSGIYGNDKILIAGNSGEKNLQRANTSDSSSVETIDVHNHQYAAGISLKSLWGAKGYSVFSLYGFGNVYFVDVSSDFTAHTYGSEGQVITHALLASRKVYYDNSDENLAAAKYEMVYRLFPSHEISAGAQYLTTGSFRDEARWDGDTARYDFNGDGVFEIPSAVWKPGNTVTTLGFGDAHKIYGYLSDKIDVLPLLTLTAGVRYDYFSYSKQGNVSPRLSASYEIVPPTTRINFAYGEYYQTQSYPLYGDNGYNGQTGYNHNLKNSHARHFVLGIEHIFAEGLKASLETYYKQYSDLPVSESFIYFSDKTFRSDHYLNVGKKTSKGIELFIQQKQVEDFYGTLSVSYSSTRQEDPRLNLPGYAPVNVGSYPDDYDYPLITTLVLGKIVKNTRSKLNEMPLYLKYPSMILPFSDDMEFSLRFRYSSGNAYTPMRYTTAEQHREGGIAWSRGWWQSTGEINSARYPDYQRLDVQWISRFHFTQWNLVVFLQVQNLLNRANVFMINHLSDGTTQTVYQFSFFPVGGCSFEF